MKIIFYVACFIIVFAQEYKTFYTAFEGSNWNDEGWFTFNLQGEKFSYCQSEQLFGGYKGFGNDSLISSQFNLPPHYSVKLQVRLWKIDSWDGETFQLIADQNVYQRNFGYYDGEDYCGIKESNDLAVMIEIIIPHYSQLLTVIMTSNLNEFADNESWGISTFILGILECPSGCLSCQDSTTECIIWSSLASYWQTSMNEDGWLINGNQLLLTSNCVGIEIAGGTSVLLIGDTIENSIKDLSPHFKIKFVFKLWALGEWVNEKFDLKINNEIWYSVPIQNSNLLSFTCDIKQRVGIINILTSNLHTSNEINMVLQTETSQKAAFWGIQSLDIFIAKCSIGCQECYGIKANECSVCMKKWGFQNLQCIPAPPLECCNVRIFQIKDLNVSFQNSFRLKIDDVSQNIIEDENNKLILDLHTSTITFQILVKCQENKKFNSFFRNCNQCQAEKYQFLNFCSNENNVIIYDATFMQIVESEKELIIRVSQTRLEIVQVSLVDEVETEILILKVDILKA